jgi:hypothetical protein
MGATVCLWSDRHAGTIVELFEHGVYRYLKWQQDKATRTDEGGMTDTQTYAYELDPKGRVRVYRFDPKREIWREVSRDWTNEKSRWKYVGGGNLAIGIRDEHYDFSF